MHFWLVDDELDFAARIRGEIATEAGQRGIDVSFELFESVDEVAGAMKPGARVPDVAILDGYIGRGRFYQVAQRLAVFSPQTKMLVCSSAGPSIKHHYAEHVRGLELAYFDKDYLPEMVEYVFDTLTESA